MIFKLRLLSLFLLFVAAFISVAQGFSNALTYSQDFQWSPASLVIKGENPYQVWIEGNREDKIILSQAPNYLHQLYIFFIPFGLLDFYTAKTIWAIINILIGLAVCLGLSSYFRLSRSNTYLLILIFLCSTPFRNGIGNGQQGLFALAFLILPFLRFRGSLVLQGIGFSKYSFAPPFFIYNIFQSGLLKATLGLILPVTGWLVFSLWTATPPFAALIQPLSVASMAVGTGTGDLMSLLSNFLDFNTLISGGIGILFATIFSFLAGRHPEHERHLPLVCLISLASFKHLGYDFVFMLPVLAYSLTALSLNIYLPIWIGVFWFWFGLRLMNALISALGMSFTHFSDLLIFFNFIILISLILLLTKSRS